MKVIIAIDQSAFAQQVVDSVLRHNWPEDTTFKVLTVIEPSQLDEFGAGKWEDLISAVQERRCKTASEVLNQARQKIQAKLPGCSVHTELRQGKARTEIVDAASEWMADKIIVGAHGRSPNRLMLAGTVPAAVAQNAHCTVELVRLAAPAAEQESRSGKVAVTQPS